MAIVYSLQWPEIDPTVVTRRRSVEIARGRSSGKRVDVVAGLLQFDGDGALSRYISSRR